MNKVVSEYIDRLQTHDFQWEDKPFDVLCQEYPNCKAALRWWCNNWRNEPHKPLQTEIASRGKLKEFMILNPPTFRISKRCCDLAKKSAGDLARAKFDVGIQFIGVRKAEGGPRSTVYKSCMADGKHGLQHFPLFWWSNDDKRHLSELMIFDTVMPTPSMVALALAAQDAHLAAGLNPNLKC